MSNGWIVVIVAGALAIELLFLVMANRGPGAWIRARLSRRPPAASDATTPGRPGADAERGPGAG